MLRSLVRKVHIILEMIKYQHAIHTLPFVYLGAFLAQKSFPGWERLGWITLGMLAARSLALGLNRYIDREIDARNPRTADRALPSGLLSDKECLAFCGLALIVCLVAAYHLPPLVWLLSPIIFTLFIFYPYTKRFTWSCHFWLGLTMGLAPLGGWVAVTNQISPAAVLLMLAVLTLIAGSDIIYTINDIEVDRNQGLYSIPAIFGLRAALRLTRVLHMFCFVFLVAVGVVLNLNIIYYIGIALATTFMAYQNSLISPTELGRIDEAFFTTNAFVSLVILIFTLSSFWFNIDIRNLPKLNEFI
jgi:4-hydroxybenzoate polyprenyltransferase